MGADASALEHPFVTLFPSIHMSSQDNRLLDLHKNHGRSKYHVELLVSAQGSKCSSLMMRVLEQQDD